MSQDKKINELEMIAKINYGMSIVGFFLHFPIYIMFILLIIYYKKSEGTYIRHHFKYQIKNCVNYMTICALFTFIFVWSGFTILDIGLKSNSMTAMTQFLLTVKQTLNSAEEKVWLELLFLRGIFFLTIIFLSTYYLIIKPIKGWMHLNDKVVP